MNIKLSVYSCRTKGKSGFAIYEKGSVVDSKVGSLSSSNIKEDVLISLVKGLRACRSRVQHEDILYIEIQNQHLCSWLSGLVEYKGYSTFLDEVFSVLESLDCRYKFMFVEKPTAKKLIEEGKVELKGMSVDNAFSDLV